ncbi:hypothetical protein SLEP1_g17074 [Rubroshorea leprosula]|uniref:Uncharacterized protein n=1 Tax=Rubroshorea leprosula TaxID=152421 RepID=A0AAV5J0N3_9ROSI|nr:hypothetical protein SLEP1_g17074 [Rubroshorea leprosula]
MPLRGQRSKLLYWMEAQEGPSCEHELHHHLGLDPLPCKEKKMN